MPPSSGPTAEYESQWWSRGFNHVAGTDEAGRGPLAGPVVAGAVILPRGVRGDDPRVRGLRDSKKLNRRQREDLYGSLRLHAVALAWAEMSPRSIEKKGILQASLAAMAKAVGGLSPPADFILVDGINGLRTTLPQQAVVKGDAVSLSIAAASIVAKVKRDGIMRRLHEKYPDYGFDVHKGYPTPEHLEILDRLGPCPAHRMSFGPVKAALEAGRSGDHG